MALALGRQICLVGLPGSVAVEIAWGQVIAGGRLSESIEKKNDQ